MKKGIVTGAQSGIGAACVDRLEREGVEVVSFDLAAGGDYQLDVSDPAAVDATVAQVGPVHILVNSAGIVGPGQTVLVKDRCGVATDLLCQRERGVQPVPGSHPRYARQGLGSYRQHREHRRQARQPKPALRK